MIVFSSFAGMEIRFYKYHGTGNDFIMIDNRSGIFDADNHELIRRMCERHTGIGADGLICLEGSEMYDFSMRYFNADGYEGSMCGNGGRCVVAFAKDLGLIEKKVVFEAVDGIHTAEIQGEGIILKMKDVVIDGNLQNEIFIDTGSPHHIEFVSAVETFPVGIEGKKIRYSDKYHPEGTNVNFVEQTGENIFKVRTYERGVEAETLSCGTGVTAVALAAYETGKTQFNKVKLDTPGGVLTVIFNKEKGGYRDIYLLGPAVKVFEGNYRI